MLKRICFLMLFGAFAFAFRLPAWAQTVAPIPAPAQTGAKPPDTPGSQVYGGYMIGVGDILDVHVNDEEDISGRYQVDQDGKLRLPLLSNTFSAAGSTTFELARQVSDELKKQDILREPAVTVLIVRGMTQNATIVGAVVRPGVYPIEKTTTLVELISTAGGLAPNAGNIVTITHHSEEETSGAKDSGGVNLKTRPINVTTMLTGHDPSSNPEIHAGDVISISNAPVIFVVGAVIKPGAFAVQDQRGQMTVLQAVAMAEGTTPTASLGRAIVVRNSSSQTQRQEIPVDLKVIMKGKSEDPVLEANDILFVPTSGLKAGLRRMGDIATGAAGQAAGYGLGLRVAQ
jgi:polysaccharide export outer membrane protein